MYGKLSAAALVLAVAAVAAHFWVPSMAAISASAGEAITLVPDQLDGARMLKHWRNPQQGTIVEVGALYARSHFGPVPVLLDFFRGDPYNHNAIGCFLDQGEHLNSEQIRTLHTAHGQAVFDVGLLRTSKHLRLIAATNCTVNGCAAHKLPFLNAFWDQWDLKNLVKPDMRSVVPVAVILTQKTTPNDNAGIKMALESEMRRVIAILDLRKAEQLAGLQVKQRVPTGREKNSAGAKAAR